MADTTLTEEADERVKSESLTREDAYGQLWVLAEDYYDALIDMDRMAADKLRAITERDAAQAEVARLTAALAEAETRGAERMREAAAGKLDELAEGMRKIAEHPDANRANATGLAALCEERAAAIRAIPLAPRERDGQEG